MPAVLFGLAVVGLVGHGAFWVGLINRLHATGYSRALVKSITLALYLGLLALPPLIFVALGAWRVSAWQRLPRELAPATVYAAFCLAYGAMHLPLWALERWRSRSLPWAVKPSGQRVIDVERQLGFAPARGWRAALLGRVPGNQLWQLHVDEFTVELARLPRSLDGFSICHLSDLHFCGRIDRPYFEEVMRAVGGLRCDLVALTGDICDFADYIDWIPSTLALVQAPAGKFFILGNHDLRTKDIARLRAAMREAGFVDLAVGPHLIHDGQIALAGNEEPWFAAPDSARLDPRTAGEALRVLLAHTPDQFSWARAHGFDLMLAGHTHGGQIRLPLVGPTICPSWHGTRYASGFFHEAPTVMHVSRGAASLLPLRINCPPHVTKLVLRSKRDGAS